MRMKWHTKLWAKIRNIFFPEPMVGGINRKPVNRHERRAAAAITRKASKRKSK